MDVVVVGLPMNVTDYCRPRWGEPGGGGAAVVLKVANKKLGFLFSMA